MKPRQHLPSIVIGRRWVSIFLFLAVFFLPLHFHAAVASAQITKECACVHGTRTQAGQIIAPTAAVPAASYEASLPILRESFVSRSVSYQFSRAPPAL